MGDDPVLDILLPPNRPRAPAGSTFTDVRAVRQDGRFGSQFGCMHINATSNVSTRDVITLTRMDRHLAERERLQAEMNVHRGTCSARSYSFFSYSAGYGNYSHSAIFFGNIGVAAALYGMVMV